MRVSFSKLLDMYIRRTDMPVSRIADLAGISRQTLFNWRNGSQPRWHSELPADLQRLGGVLKLEEAELRSLLFAGGCACDQENWTDLESRSTVAPNSNSAYVVPSGWFLAGTRPTDYHMGVCSDVTYVGSRCATLKSRQTVEPSGFGTLMQSFRSTSFRGKRVRFTAMARCESIEQWAGLWMRVDEETKDRSLAFDNMSNRPMKGTMDWTAHSIVLDVAESSTAIALGVLLGGPGQVWLSQCKFEVVGKEIPTTNLEDHQPDGPTNLAFV